MLLAPVSKIASYGSRCESFSDSVAVVDVKAFLAGAMMKDVVGMGVKRLRNN